MSSAPSEAAVGFIGLGVMGEAMCANIVRRGPSPVIAYDLDPGPVARLAEAGARPAASAAEVGEAASVVLLSLPAAEHVQQVVLGDDGLLAVSKPGQVIVDLGTSGVGPTRELARTCAERGVTFCDAPVARTRAAAVAGKLSVMVGGDEETFGSLRPLLECIATDITHCGPVGSGQLAKLMNNIVLFTEVLALSEAAVVAERNGMSREALFGILAKGSADSFALRNHGRAIAADSYPEAAFPTSYAAKDASYALRLAAEAGVDARAFALVHDTLRRTIDAGFAAEYFPVLARVVAQGEAKD